MITNTEIARKILSYGIDELKGRNIMSSLEMETLEAMFEKFCYSGMEEREATPQELFEHELKTCTWGWKEAL